MCSRVLLSVPSAGPSAFPANEPRKKNMRTNEQPEEEDHGITAVPGTASFVPVAFDNYLLMPRISHNGSRRIQTLKLQSEYHES